MSMPLPLVESLGDLGDPAEVAARFLDLPYLLLLDSSTGASSRGEAHPLGHFSFLSADPAGVVRSKGRDVALREGGVWRAVSEDPLLLVRRILAEWRSDPVPGLPPFQGGAAGYVGYDYGAVLERLHAKRYDDLPVYSHVYRLDE